MSSVGTPVDLYAVLGVPRTATPAEIRAAYRALALRYHPDRNIDTSDTVNTTAGESRQTLIDKFDAIQRAADTLLDEALRKDYDQKLEAQEAKLAQVHSEINVEELLECEEHVANGSQEQSAPDDDEDSAGASLCGVYQCRCGSAMHVPLAEFQSKDSLVIECDACSTIYKFVV